MARNGNLEPSVVGIVVGTALASALGVRWILRKTQLSFHTRAAIGLGELAAGATVAVLAPKYLAAVGAGIAAGGAITAAENTMDGYQLATLTGAQLPSTTSG